MPRLILTNNGIQKGHKVMWEAAHPLIADEPMGYGAIVAGTVGDIGPIGEMGQTGPMDHDIWLTPEEVAQLQHFEDLNQKPTMVFQGADTAIPDPIVVPSYRQRMQKLMEDLGVLGSTMKDAAPRRSPQKPLPPVLTSPRLVVNDCDPCK